jgi:ribokinase
MTLGRDGVLLDTGGRRMLLPAVAVDRVVDTTGAGDAFTAALAVGLVEGLPFARAAELAARAGAHAVTREGVLPSLPSRHDLYGTETERIPRYGLA